MAGSPDAASGAAACSCGIGRSRTTRRRDAERKQIANPLQAEVHETFYNPCIHTRMPGIVRRWSPGAINEPKAKVP